MRSREEAEVRAQGTQGQHRGRTEAERKSVDDGSGVKQVGGPQMFTGQSCLPCSIPPSPFHYKLPPPWGGGMGRGGSGGRGAGAMGAKMEEGREGRAPLGCPP